MKNDHLPHAWTAICPLDDIVPNTGVCALVNGEQVAVFHVDGGADANCAPAVYAIENFDPASH
ncbi:nitrite reductase (NAD(P)H) small subunit, partial [Paraburkholderia sp.]|uniref:nitrite reductase (NAD(P)H) small subunit n=1 Tax=Paraburkholderia sp. TaxID=1926495 RepID=UPI002F40790A